MQLPSAAAGSGAGGYAKVDKMDAEEARHLKAQYLIHKVLEEASTAVARPPPPPPAPARRPPALARVKARIGVRLKKLRLAIRGVRARARRGVQRHLRNLRRLVALRGRLQGSSVKPASATAVCPS